MTWDQRAAEGERLASQADDPTVQPRLMELLLDDEDTAVTYRTALALLQRRDRIAMELVVAADVRADDDTGQWLYEAIMSLSADSLGEDDDYLRTSLLALARDGDTATRESALQLLSDTRLDRPPPGQA